VRQSLGREAAPLGPGDEWPHGFFPLPVGAQDQLQMWAVGLESELKHSEV